MNFKKVEKAAKKINHLLDNMKDEEQVSKIEKDLLLSYIRDLYEKVIYSEESSKKSTPKSTVDKKVTKSHIPEPVKEVKSHAPQVEIADVVRQEIKETVYQSDSTPVKKTVEAPLVEEPTAPSFNNAPQELLELFEAGSVNEISDKLSRSPISDLTKSMGINERIFTVNELFGGDSGLFNTTMQELDKLSSLEQARDYLVTNVAVDQNWSSESKIKKAATFVKLIGRRY
jgi:hypothetical protein